MRYKITIEYDGTNYNGWQRQNGNNSIQGAIEQALKQLSCEDIEVCGCGRTDAGVHAMGQVAHFDMQKELPIHTIISGTNFYLRMQHLSRFSVQKQDISILDCSIVDNTFHARFSAKQRYYRYLILNQKQPSALECDRMWYVYKELDLDSMITATQYLRGFRDWSCFRASSCQAGSPIKTIDNAQLRREENKIIFEINAKSFLHHMVRNIVGTLVDVGTHKTTLDDFQRIIDSKDRTKAGMTAPAHGLYFVKAVY